MEIPNSNPLGGDVDGMGDLDNAPIPPMGADNNGMGMEDPMGGDPNAMQDPNAMGGDPNMDMGGEPMMDDQNAMGDDDELMNIINGLSIEDKAAVTKYAKSMVDNSEGDEMPMESKKNIKSIIDEVIGDVLSDTEGTKRPEAKMPRKYRPMTTPFKSPF